MQISWLARFESVQYWNVSETHEMPEPKENNCFSIIAQVIIRATAFSFILLVSPLKTSRHRAAAILKISASEL